MQELMTLVAKVEQLGGLWISPEAVDSALSELQHSGRGQAKGKQVEALKTQLTYRKKMLRQPVVDPKQWTFSENGRQCSVMDLAQKLKTVIAQTPTINVTN